MTSCPCGSQEKFSACCEPYLNGEAEAPTAEKLMRSRYTAFVKQNLDYIFETTDPQTRTNFNMKANEEWAKSSEFVSLEILRSSEEGNKGLVEFKASFKDPSGQMQAHHEISKFRKQAGVWFFREGKVMGE